MLNCVETSHECPKQEHLKVLPGLYIQLWQRVIGCLGKTLSVVTRGALPEHNEHSRLFCFSPFACSTEAISKPYSQNYTDNTDDGGPQIKR